MQQIYDLHCHSYFSDGALSPTELVTRAHTNGVTHLALTDHDSIAGIAEARQAIMDQQLALELIAGTEITCRWEQFEIHLIGLNFDPQAPAIQSLLVAQQERRKERYQAMVTKLHQAGIDIQPPLAKDMTMPTRKH